MKENNCLVRCVGVWEWHVGGLPPTVAVARPHIREPDKHTLNGDHSQCRILKKPSSIYIPSSVTISATFDTAIYTPCLKCFLLLVSESTPGTRTIFLCGHLFSLNGAFEILVVLGRSLQTPCFFFPQYTF